MEKQKDTADIISLKDVEKFEKNPFMIELKGRMFLQPRANTIIAKGQSLVDTNTGEVIDDSILIGRRKVVDKSEFAKIYTADMALLYGISKPAQNVFMHLAKIMDYDNKALFDYQQEHKKIGYSTHRPALKGLRELIANGIIAPHIIGGVWWLNPTIVCKGERYLKYTEYVTQEYLDKEKRQKALRQGQMEIIETDQQYKIDAMNKAEEEHYHKTGRLLQTNIFGEVKIQNPYTTEDTANEDEKTD